jgi:hypothetical protein
MSRTRTPRFRVFPWALFRQVFARFFVLAMLVSAFALVLMCALHSFVTWSLDGWAILDATALRFCVMVSAITALFVASAAADAKARNMWPKGSDE